MKKEIQLTMPMMPNFIKAIIPGGTEASIPVHSLTEEEAIQYAEEMGKAFIDHWEKKNAAPIPTGPINR